MRVVGVDDHPSFKEIWTLLGIGTTVVFLRCLARYQAVGFRGYQADDYLIILALSAYVAETTMAYQVLAWYNGLSNNGMSDKHRAKLDPNGDEYRMRVAGSKALIVDWLMYALMLWLVKSALCTYFLRLTERLGNYRTRIHFGFGLLFATWLTVTLSMLLGCMPLSKNWQIYPDPGVLCQPAVSRTNIFVTLSLNIASDLYLLTIPIPMLWAAQIQPWKKFGLIVLFSSGLLVITAGILRCVMILGYDISGTERGRHGSEWAIRESFVAIVSSNLPLVYPLIREWIINIANLFGSRHGRSSVRISSHTDPWKSRNDIYGHRGFSNASTRNLNKTMEPSARDIRTDLDIKVTSIMRKDTHRFDSIHDPEYSAQ